MRTSALCLILIAGLLAASGCNVSRPRWFFPGTAQQQQRRAQQYDPYPDPELGPHDGKRSRPRGFENPPPEVTKGRRSRWSWPGFQF